MVQSSKTSRCHILIFTLTEFTFKSGQYALEFLDTNIVGLCQTFILVVVHLGITWHYHAVLSQD